MQGEVLALNNVQRSDMGVYLCIATNGVPPSVSKRFQVQVHCKYEQPSETLSRNVRFNHSSLSLVMIERDGRLIT